MKRADIITIMTLILMTTGPVVADQALDQAATMSIVERLTSENRTTWIPAGTIVARRQEYRAAQTTDAAAVSAEIERQLAAYRADPRPEVAPELQRMRIEAIPFNVRYWMSNEYTMDSSVIMRYDGNRFYWEINIESRRDSVTVPSELRGNYMTEELNLDWNEKRVFVFDGQNYSAYAGPADRAIVDAGVGMLAPALGGALTAGLIRWGSGSLTYENLSQARISAVSASRNEATEVQMVVDQPNGLSMHFVLDPAKDYAMTSCRLSGRGNTVIEDRYYSGYRQIAGHWVPTTVLIERHDVVTDRLISSDKWDFIAVDGVVPGPETFSMDYTVDTVVEYYSPIEGAATFNYSNRVDTDRLLAERLTYVATKSTQPRNCATAALQYAAGQFGKSVSDSVLTRLVQGDGQTSLYDLKQAAQGLGLHCRAVTTDIATLAERPDCVAILHLPGTNHFVVLDHVDEQYAWLVDLSSRRFYYRQDVALLPADWSEGTALLLSTQPIKGDFRDISDSVLSLIVGAEGGWSCTKLLQDQYMIPCIETDYGCTDVWRGFYRRYGCEAAESGTCFEQPMYRMVASPCYSEPDGTCLLTEFFFYYMLACW